MIFMAQMTSPDLRSLFKIQLSMELDTSSIKLNTESEGKAFSLFCWLVCEGDLFHCLIINQYEPIFLLQF